MLRMQRITKRNNCAHGSFLTMKRSKAIPTNGPYIERQCNIYQQTEHGLPIINTTAMLAIPNPRVVSSRKGRGGAVLDGASSLRSSRALGVCSASLLVARGSEVASVARGVRGGGVADIADVEVVVVVVAAISDMDVVAVATL